MTKKDCTVTVEARPGEDKAAALARTWMNPIVQAADTTASYAREQGLELDALISELSRQTETIESGDLRAVTGMLVAQAHTLDKLFGHLAAQAANAQCLGPFEAYLRLALRAQNQCRSTLEAVAAIRSLNSVRISQTKVKERANGRRLDAGTTGSTCGIQPPPSAMGKVNGAPYAGR